MYIKVRYFGLVYSVTGIYEEEILIEDGYTISRLIKDIVDRFEGLSRLLFLEDGSLNPLYRITVNGRDIEHLDGLETRLSGGDVVALIGPAGG